VSTEALEKDIRDIAPQCSHVILAQLFMT